jgi:site-specific DNA-cytosine methylase
MRRHVVSLFDGIGCGLLALIEAGQRNFVYSRSEIDEKANAVFHDNFTPEFLSQYDITVEDLGDVRQVLRTSGGWLFDREIHLIMGGSPCQSVSIQGKRNGMEGESGLFDEFVRIKNALPHRYFFLENVPMKNEFLQYFNERMGVNPLEIDSSIFSAQSRRRLYWMNISYRGLPCVTCSDTVRSIMLHDVPDKYFINPQQEVIPTVPAGKRCLAYIGDNKTANRVYDIDGKSVTLIANGGGLGAKTGLYFIPKMAFPHDGEQFTTMINKGGVDVKGYIRRLTPLECERLQGLPDDFTKAAGSDTARYRVINNGWNVETITHLLRRAL